MRFVMAALAAVTGAPLPPREVLRSLIEEAVLLPAGDVVAALLAVPAEVPPAPEDLAQAMLYACRYRKPVAVVEALLAAGAPLDVEDASGNTPLLMAALHGHAPLIRYFMEHGAELGATNTLGNSLLLKLAAVTGRRRAAKALAALKLVLAAADSPAALAPLLAVVNKVGDNVFHKLARQGSSDMADMLLAAADPSLAADLLATVNAAGETPLHAAARLGHDSVLSRYLAHASPNIRDANGATPLMVVGIERALGLYLGTAACLGDAGADVNAVDAAGRTALHNATATIELAQWLLDRGAALEVRDAAGETPLAAALRAGALPRFHFLLNAGAQLAPLWPLFPPCDVFGALASYSASSPSAFTAVRDQLVAAIDGVAVDRVAVDAALDSALAGFHLDGCSLALASLDALGVESAELEAAMTARRDAVFGTLDDDGANLVHCAASADADTLLTKLLSYFPAARDALSTPAPGQAEFSDGGRPLHFAAQANALDAITVLLAAGADVDAVEPTFGFTPLMAAARSGATAAATALLAAGASPAITNIHDETAADIADLAGHIDLADLVRPPR
ncbi:ankyrin [Thecamonas trahens ATCC 50062]|uniref:Ankyrin n=1 Tax=Thecamonas trahens ATCC 50062 TaxID=461836 RepID=A0A0L0DLV5_THETB|nr:ankyrin [Thecamonas trahens ATCC 50062]KNC53292.1 ankyrin [Thecamonas trahens ATCC 50062]|eukprot:XP_013754554.1 ankyrin [Thecamonas trahens ATCC 50062]